MKTTFRLKSKDLAGILTYIAGEKEDIGEIPKHTANSINAVMHCPSFVNDEWAFTVYNNFLSIEKV